MPLNRDRYTLLRKGIFDDSEISVYTNSQTDFCFLYPQGTVDYIEYSSRVDQLDLQQYESTLGVYQRRLRILSDLFSTQKSVLEIGAGNGEFLEELYREGIRNICGIDFDLRTERNRRKYSNLDINSITEAKQRNLKFDVVCLFHVFEHIIDPQTFLRSIIDVTSAESSVIIETPSLRDPLYSMYASDAYKRFYFQKQHPYVYSHTSLVKVLEAYGFVTDRLISFQRYGLENHLQWLAYGTPGGSAEFYEVTKNIEDEYKNNLERKECTDSVI